MRLIDTDELKNRKIVVNYDEIQDTFDDGLLFVTNLVDKSPTVDAVPVVRCKDCVHSVLDECGYRFCDYIMGGSDVGDLFFCADGERKGG